MWEHAPYKEEQELATLDKVDVDTSWKNIVTESSLTDDESYKLQNTGGKDVRYIEATDEPDLDVRNYLFLRPGWSEEVKVASGEGWWVRVQRGESILAVTEVS